MSYGYLLGQRTTRFSSPALARCVWIMKVLYGCGEPLTLGMKSQPWRRHSLSYKTVAILDFIPISFMPDKINTDMGSHKMEATSVAQPVSQIQT